MTIAANRTAAKVGTCTSVIALALMKKSRVE